jgi:hydroxyacylglutathione hydrolase
MILFQQDQLTVFQSALFRTNSAVIEGDSFVLVVDSTWLPQEVEEIRQHVGW